MTFYIILFISSLIDVGNQFDSGNRLKSPRYIWSNHSLPITSIFTGLGGHQCHIVTASKDQTCKVWAELRLLNQLWVKLFLSIHYVH